MCHLCAEGSVGSVSQDSVLSQYIYYYTSISLSQYLKYLDISSARFLSSNQVFDLRAEGSVDEDAWAELVSEDLRLTMPITPYRSFSPADVVNNRRVLLGVDGEGTSLLIWRLLGFLGPIVFIDYCLLASICMPSLA